MLNKLFRFFIFSSLFIALCAVLMVWQTYYLIIHAPTDYIFQGFVFLSTICSYNFHWFLTGHSVNPSQRIQWAQEHKGYHFALFLLGGIGSAYFFFRLIHHWPWLMLGAFITFLYSAPKVPHKAFGFLKRIAVGKTIFLAMVWTYVTAILPILVAESPFRLDMLLYIIGRFFLIYAICILFDYRDRADDKADGIRSMITYFDESGINKLFAVSLAICFFSTMAMFWFGHSLPVIGILLIPAIIVAALYNYAKKNFSDIFYYFVLDGLMMLSSLLMLLLSF